MENRRVISKVLPDLYHRARINRLAPFFNAMRLGLQEVAASTAEAPRVVLLSSGPMSETAYDQAFLSQLLGYPLVSGTDLYVREGRLMLRGIEGPEQVDVVLRRVPVPFLMNYDNFQHAYYALETMGAVDAMQQKIFRAIHVDRQRLEKPEDIAAFVGKNGGDATKFLAAFKSFSVATSVSRAKKMVADYKVESVPLLTVAGRYATSPALANGGPQSLAVVDALVQRTRKG